MWIKADLESLYRMKFGSCLDEHIESDPPEGINIRRYTQEDLLCRTRRHHGDEARILLDPLDGEVVR